MRLRVSAAALIAIALTGRPSLSNLYADSPAVHLRQPLPTTIRVCLMHAKRPVRLGCTGSYDFMLLAGGRVGSSKRMQTVAPAGRHSITLGHTRYNGDVLVAPVQPDDYLTVNGRRYRGALILEPAGSGRFDVVEQLDFEEYLYGVLPREMGPDWPIEALKAQAVVSRTYVLANRGGGRYDIASDVSAQVYGGLEDESPAATQAVRATRGQVLVDKRGDPIQAFFHSSCGGQTEIPKNVWNADSSWDYFTSVKDPYCQDDPFYHWRWAVSAARLEAKLRRAGIRVGAIRKIQAAQKSPSGRVRTFLIVGSRRKATLAGNRFRLAVGPEALRSTLITSISTSRTGFRFEGRGWGHGIGLCQYGARGRANAGIRYDDIVKAYYPDTYLVQGYTGEPVSRQ